ncbi:MAG TPA: GNAT family N-acetyltransferase [Coriobacteriia bacterium]|jgi:RimJ/RimL family protein N-acetyltransferase
MIRGAKTRLRPLEESDLDAVLGWRNAVRDRFRDDRLLTMADQQAWFARYARDDTDQCYVIQTLDERSIGMVCLSRIDRTAGTAEFGRLIIGDPESLGRGYASDAAEALVSDAFERLDLETLHLVVLESNGPALALYTRLGFERDGDAEAEELAGRGSLLRMSLDRRRWEQR